MTSIKGVLFLKNVDGEMEWVNGDSGNEGKYEGEIENWEPNGIGNITYLIGIKYVGEWKDGKYNGQGTLTLPNGEKYVGEWKNGERHGQGIYTSPDGAKYEGEFKDFEKHGHGIETFPHGDKYVGGFKDGFKNGQGTYTWSNGGKYVGEYKDGDPNGQGTETFPNGNQYVGEFKDGKRNGQGTYTWSNGEKYDGEWRKNIEWNLTIFDKDGNIIGRFANGKRSLGKGEEIGILYVGVRNDEFGFYKDEWEGIKSIKSQDYGKYEGIIKNGFPNGQGTYTLPERENIVGEFKDGKPWNGTGYNKNGNITVKWVKGKMKEQ
jgi:hypothetical protein